MEVHPFKVANVQNCLQRCGKLWKYGSNTFPYITSLYNRIDAQMFDLLTTAKCYYLKDFILSDNKHQIIANHQI